MISRKELKELLLEHALDALGNLDLSGLDFSDFDGNVYLNNLKVKKDLYQYSQRVGQTLYQNTQKVRQTIHQEECSADRILQTDHHYFTLVADGRHTKVKRRMTKEEIEEKLGHQVDIVDE